MQILYCTNILEKGGLEYNAVQTTRVVVSAPFFTQIDFSFLVLALYHQVFLHCRLWPGLSSFSHTNQKEILLFAELPQYSPPLFSGHPAALCWCCPGSSWPCCQHTPSLFSGCMCLKQHIYVIQSVISAAYEQLFILYTTSISQDVLPNSMKEYGLVTVDTFLPYWS